MELNREDKNNLRTGVFEGLEWPSNLQGLKLGVTRLNSMENFSFQACVT